MASGQRGTPSSLQPPTLGRWIGTTGIKGLASGPVSLQDIEAMKSVFFKGQGEERKGRPPRAAPQNPGSWVLHLLGQN